ncbi:50S ribosomal protein L34e [Candidatus Woesearchaeota archaeon]|nr:50S ribosomal protein L34e [Candidatus Woesearchaeota archaeon]MBW3021505.1 50S ribosomal protein L34e [Candidatus Woesearchaeota archaeon]
MPAGRHKSRTMRRVHVKTPGGKTSLQYRRRKPGKAKCGKCGKILSGVPRELPYKMRNMAKTKKRPERPFGGVLCPACSRALLKEKARSLK